MDLIIITMFTMNSFLFCFFQFNLIQKIGIFGDLHLLDFLVTFEKRKANIFIVLRNQKPLVIIRRVIINVQY